MSDSSFPSLLACRVCLSHSFTGGINLNQNEDMLQMFEFCVGLSIKLQCLPKILCTDCAETIKGYAKFKRKCEESEELWKSYNNITVNNNSKCEFPKNEIKQEYVKCEDTNFSYNEEHSLFESHDLEFEHDFKDTVNYEAEHFTENSHFHVLNKDTIYKNRNKVENRVLKQYKCKKCKKEYSNHRWLVMHEKNCFTHISNKNKIEKTNLNTDSNNDSSSDLNCGLCSTQVCGTDDLLKHFNEHWSNNDLKCQLCSYAGKDFADMVTHSFQHRTKRKLFCPVCYKKKASVFSLQFHFRSVHLQKAGGLCSVCNKTFIKYKSWTKHERLHNENNLFICDHCGRRYVFRHEIKSHLIHHTGERQFVCETCGNSFRRMSGLKDHIENVHNSNQPAKCDHCNKIYKNHIKLQLHMKNIAKEKSYICEVCSKKFVSQKVLEKHMFWHSGERPFNCEVCGSKYKAKGQLNIHMRRHTGFMPHKCVDCGKGFPNSYQLKRHVSVHTGVRAHKCVMCERSFHEKKALVEHAALHKNVDNVKLEN